MIHFLQKIDRNNTSLIIKNTISGLFYRSPGLIRSSILKNDHGRAGLFLFLRVFILLSLLFPAVAFCMKEVVGQGVITTVAGNGTGGG